MESDEQKQKILLAVLLERYNASHIMRERSMRFTLWLSGIAVPIGWLLISKQHLLWGEKLGLALFVVALFGGTIFFLHGLKIGFEKNREVMIRCEGALGLFEKGKYLADTAILSPAYGSTTQKWCDHFSTIGAWLLIIAMSLQILIWTTPTSVDSAAQKKTNIEAFSKGEKSYGKSA